MLPQVDIVSSEASLNAAASLLFDSDSYSNLFLDCEWRPGSPRLALLTVCGYKSSTVTSKPADDLRGVPECVGDNATVLTVTNFNKLLLKSGHTSPVFVIDALTLSGTASFRAFVVRLLQLQCHCQSGENFNSMKRVFGYSILNDLRKMSTGCDWGSGEESEKE